MKNVTVFLALRIVLLTIIVHAVALIGPIWVLKAAFIWLSANGIRSVMFGVVAVTADMVFLLLSCTIVTGFCSRILKLRYDGTHEMSAQVPAVRCWLCHMATYLPTAVLLDFLHLYPLKTLHARLCGARIGKNVVLAGLILDPSLCTIEDGSHIGGFSVIFGHSAEADRQRVTFAAVRIGKRCAVGARAVIMPGACMEDGSRLGPQSLLLPMQILAVDTLYLGVPARKIMVTPTQVATNSSLRECAHV